MSSTNVTLANQQADTVQIQFGTSYYTTDATVATAQSYEPDILGVSKQQSMYHEDGSKKVLL